MAIWIFDSGLLDDVVIQYGLIIFWLHFGYILVTCMYWL